MDSSGHGLHGTFKNEPGRACIGLWPSTGALLCLTVSLAAGLVLLPATSSNLPLLGLWMMPLLSLAGGASVSGAVRRRN